EVLEVAHAADFVTAGTRGEIDSGRARESPVRAGHRRFAYTRRDPGPAAPRAGPPRGDHDRADHRTDPVPRRALGAHRRRRLAQRPNRGDGRGRLEGRVLAGLARGAGADRLGLRPGACRPGRAVAAAGVDAPRGLAVHVALVR